MLVSGRWRRIRRFALPGSPCWRPETRPGAARVRYSCNWRSFTEMRRKRNARMCLPGDSAQLAFIHRDVAETERQNAPPGRLGPTGVHSPGYSRKGTPVCDGGAGAGGASGIAGSGRYLLVGYPLGIARTRRSGAGVPHEVARAVPRRLLMEWEAGLQDYLRTPDRQGPAHRGRYRRRRRPTRSCAGVTSTEERHVTRTPFRPRRHHGRRP